MTPICFLYRFFDKENRLLYVGISYHMERRLDQHRFQKPWGQIARIDVASYSTRLEAEQAERVAIQTEKPEWNVLHNSGRPTRQVGGQIHDGEWWWTRQPVPGFLCHKCGKEFEDRPAIMRYRKEKDPFRAISDGSYRSQWSRLGWSLWLEHECGWAEHRIAIDDGRVKQLGRLGAGWEPLP